MKFTRFIFIFTLVMICFITNKGKALADDKLPFSVKPIFTSNQDPSVNGYFSLHVHPNETYSLSFELKNLSDKSLKIKLKPANALTTKNGGINYTESNKTDFTSFLNNDFKAAQYIKAKDEVTLDPNETKTVDVVVHVPNLHKGVLLGGVLFYPELEETSKNETNKGNVSLQLINQYAFAVAVQLLLPDTEKESLSFGKVDTVLSASGLQLLMDIKNNSANVTKLKDFHFKVYDSSDTLVFEGENPEVKMAPKTKISYPYFWKGELKEGKYSIKITGKVVDKNKKYETTFTIKKQKLNQYISDNKKRKDPVVVENKTPWWMWLLIIIIPVIAFVLGKKGLRTNKAKTVTQDETVTSNENESEPVENTQEKIEENSDENKQ